MTMQFSTAEAEDSCHTPRKEGYSSLLRLYLKYCAQFYVPWSQKDMEEIQRRVTKMIKAKTTLETVHVSMHVLVP